MPALHIILRLRKASSFLPSSDYPATTGIMLARNRTPILKYIYPAIKRQLLSDCKYRKKSE